MNHNYGLVACCFNCKVPQRDGTCPYQDNEKVMCNYVCDKVEVKVLEEDSPAK